MYSANSLSSDDMSPIGKRNKYLRSARMGKWNSASDEFIKDCVIRARFWHRVWMRSGAFKFRTRLPQLDRRQAN